MSRPRKLLVVGEEPTGDEWKEIEAMRKDLEDKGMNVVKVLNYKDGPVKLIGKLKPEKVLHEVRLKIEEDGWHIQAPYYEHGTLAGFKLAKTGTQRDGRAWSAGT